MVWQVECTDEFEAWWATLATEDQDAVIAAVAQLERVGPGLGRPLADSIRRSDDPNVQEFLPPTGGIRVEFTVDSERKAILLNGGDQTGRWESWYDEMIPIADRLYDEYLATVRRDGVLP
jgi:hypothetical protein